jgi:uncharacterized protein
MIETVAATVVGVCALVVAAGAPSFAGDMRLFSRRARFGCRMCGNCCRFRVTPLTSEDVKRLEAAGHADFFRTAGELMLRRVNGRCVFLKDDRCTVHDVRPQVCRDFPFFRACGIGYAQKASFCPGLEELEDGGRG